MIESTLDEPAAGSEAFPIGVVAPGAFFLLFFHVEKENQEKQFRLACGWRDLRLFFVVACRRSDPVDNPLRLAGKRTPPATTTAKGEKKTFQFYKEQQRRQPQKKKKKQYETRRPNQNPIHSIGGLPAFFFLFFFYSIPLPPPHSVGLVSHARFVIFSPFNSVTAAHLHDFDTFHNLCCAFDRVVPSFTEFYLPLPGSTGFYRVLLGFTGFLLGFTWFHWVLLCFTAFYWVSLGFTMLYWVLLGCTGLNLIFIFNWMAFHTVWLRALLFYG